MKKRKIMRSRMKGKQIKLAIAWYKSEQWEHLRKISADRDDLEDTWEEWEANVEKSLKGFVGKGVIPVKTVVDTEELQAWCKEQGKPVDGANRSFYATHLLRKMDEVE